MRNIVRIQGIALTDSGQYLFEVFYKQSKDEYKKVAELPLEVVITRSKEYLRAD